MTIQSQRGGNRFLSHKGNDMEGMSVTPNTSSRNTNFWLKIAQGGASKEPPWFLKLCLNRCLLMAWVRGDTNTPKVYIFNPILNYKSISTLCCGKNLKYMGRSATDERHNWRV